MFKRFKKLPKGIQRLLIGGTFIAPFLIGTVFTIGSSNYGRAEDYAGGVVAGVFIYWFFVFIGAWAYEGFKDDKTK